MPDLSRHRRLSLTGETLVNPLSTVSAFSRVLRGGSAAFYSTSTQEERAQMRDRTRYEKRHDIILQAICVARVR